MDRGEIVEEGSHDELIAIKDGIYAHLNQLQFGLRSGGLKVMEG
jgi:subfamily B ATP-binding cassette protein MsbA